MQEDIAIEEGAEVKDKEEKKKKAPRKSRKSPAVKQVTQGRIYIQATYNNTLITATDMHGNVLAWSSSGHMGFRGPRKATPYASSVVVRDLAEKLRPMGFRDIHVLMTGVGSGRESAVRALNSQGLNVISIRDITPLPHNGCRKPRPRRV